MYVFRQSAGPFSFQTRQGGLRVLIRVHIIYQDAETVSMHMPVPSRDAVHDSTGMDAECSKNLAPGVISVPHQLRWAS